MHLKPQYFKNKFLSENDILLYFYTFIAHIIEKRSELDIGKFNAFVD
jgi:hypothetical protein